MDDEFEDGDKKHSIKRHKPINRKTKLSIVFNEKARKAFLTGFRKRKQERRRKAQEQLKEWLKEERKRIKKEAREEIKKLVLTNRPIPELEHINQEDYELPNHSVSVVELNPVDLENKNHWIGTNRVQYETDKEEESDNEDREENGEEENSILGMELKSEKHLKRVIKKKATKQVQKSKAFQTKQRLEKKKQIKKAHKNKHERVKMRMKKHKFKGNKCKR